MRHSERKIRVLVVWEPILPTDWTAPSSSILARIPDSRVRQFYDPHHVVAEALNEMAAKKPPEPKPNCCKRKEFYWDDAILYAPQVHWSDAPASVFWDGPVDRVIPALDSALNKQAAP